MTTSNKSNASTDQSEGIRQRLVRLDEMVPCTTAFIDARTPGSDKKENFCLIGEGVTENTEQIVHIDIPHGFNVGAARQPNGCKNSHHSHDTEEVFMIFSGKWRFTWGENGEDGDVVLTQGDTISLPKHMFRGFENIGDDGAFMFSILGLDDNGTAGQVMWAPYVFKQAKHHGLVLLEDGRLIDTAAGKKIPDDGVEQTPTSAEQAASLSRPSANEMANCIARQNQYKELSSGGLSAINGITELAIIGPENLTENIGAGKIAWPHGFVLRRLTLQPDANIATHFRAEEEVIIVQSGRLCVTIESNELILNAGDVLSVPIGHNREFKNAHDQITDAFVIRRGDNPLPAQFVNNG